MVQAEWGVQGNMQTLLTFLSNFLGAVKVLEGRPVLAGPEPHSKAMMNDTTWSSISTRQSLAAGSTLNQLHAKAIAACNDKLGSLHPASLQADLKGGGAVCMLFPDSCQGL